MYSCTPYLISNYLSLAQVRSEQHPSWKKMLVAGEASGSESCLTDNLRGAGGVEGEQTLAWNLHDID